MAKLKTEKQYEKVGAIGYVPQGLRNYDDLIQIFPATVGVVQWAFALDPKDSSIPF